MKKVKKMYTAWGDDDIQEYIVTGETKRFYEVKSIEKDHVRYHVVDKNDDCFFTDRNDCYEKLIRTIESGIEHLIKRKESHLEEVRTTEESIGVQKKKLIAIKKKIK